MNRDAPSAKSDRPICFVGPSEPGKPMCRITTAEMVGDTEITHVFVDEAPQSWGDPKDIKPLVIIESPFAGDIKRNITFARACVRDSLMRGEAPFASHLLYTQPGILRDEVHAERELGMGVGWHIMRRAKRVCVYLDLGWSSGMKRGVLAAHAAGVAVEERRLGPLDTWLENYNAHDNIPTYYGF